MTQIYVQVYDRLRKMIDDGAFPVGSPLPAEVKLAKMLDTSRMTLRQALDLLHEDGLLKKVKGSGNYVKMRDTDMNPVLHRLGNPIEKCLRERYDRIESEFYVEQSNDYARGIFGENICEYVSSYQYYYSKDKLLAYTYSAMSVDMAEKLQVNLKEKANRDSFFLQDVYEKAKRAHIEIMMDFNAASLWPTELEEDERIAFMMEKIYNDNFEIMVYNKHYFLAEECRVTIEAE